MATADEVADLLQQLRPGKDLRRDFVENRVDVLEFLKRRANYDQRGDLGGRFLFTHAELAHHLDPDVPLDTSVARTKFASTTRMLRDLQAVGLIEFGAECSTAGATISRGRRARGGQYKCMWFRLLPVEDAFASLESGAHAGVAQSVRAAES